MIYLELCKLNRKGSISSDNIEANVEFESSICLFHLITSIIQW